MRILIATLILSCGILAAGSAPASDNVIVFVADDLGWNDLPFFSPPVEWESIPGSSWADKRIEAQYRSASANRFDARVFARPDGPGAVPGEFRKPDLVSRYEVRAADWQYKEGEPYEAYITRPDASRAPDDCADTQTSAALATCANAETDILPGFGGLSRLAHEGVVFPRFYTNSPKCAPSRAALFTGRYPPAINVTLNGAQLARTDVTIAEYLKQGCSAEGVPAEKRCREFSPTGARGRECECYAGDCESMPCYRTGLIGKWHLGGRKGSEPWNQGFDEFFGFGGASRHYWDNTALQCSPVLGYCSEDPSDANTKACSSDAECAGSSPGRCAPRALYLGTKRGVNPCTGADDDPDCCVPSDQVGSARGRYKVKKHLGGKDNPRMGQRPCSDTGLTKDTGCGYSTRVFGDQARNFIVRNAQIEPFLLVVSYHAPHKVSAAPASTEDHYETNIDDDAQGLADEPPYNLGAQYWGSMEELDSSIGQLVDLLDAKGACEETAEPCTESTGDCTCLPLGRSPEGAPCSTSDADCEPLSRRTAVFFLSDHGRPHAQVQYGNPELRGGKSTVYEGGVRVGLLVRHPRQAKGLCSTAASPKPCDPAAPQCEAGEGECVGPGICRNALPLKGCDPALPDQCAEEGDGPCEHLLARAPLLASMADLFPTIAEIAGVPRAALSGGRARLSAADPSQTTDGQSFLSALTGASSGPGRTRVFASYPADGMTVITDENDPVNDGEFAVCAYDSGAAPPAAASQRRVTGASCVHPSATSPANDCTQVWCKLPGRACVARIDSFAGCTPGAKTCLKDTGLYEFEFDPDSKRRGLLHCSATADCPTDAGVPLECRGDVWVRCNTEQSRTLWKLKAASNATATADANSQLFELRSNPHEEELLDCHGQGVDAAPDFAVSSLLFDGSRIDGLKNWKECVDHSAACERPVP